MFFLIQYCSLTVPLIYLFHRPHIHSEKSTNNRSWDKIHSTLQRALVSSLRRVLACVWCCTRRLGSLCEIKCASERLPLILLLIFSSCRRKRVRSCRCFSGVFSQMDGYEAGRFVVSRWCTIQSSRATAIIPCVCFWGRGVSIYTARGSLVDRICLWVSLDVRMRWMFTSCSLFFYLSPVNCVPWSDKIAFSQPILGMESSNMPRILAAAVAFFSEYNRVNFEKTSIVARIHFM